MEIDATDEEIMLENCISKCQEDSRNDIAEMLPHLRSRATAESFINYRVREQIQCERDCRDTVYIPNPEILEDARTCGMFQARQEALQRNLFPYWTDEVSYYHPTSVVLPVTHPRSVVVPDITVTAELAQRQPLPPPELGLGLDAHGLIRLYGGRQQNRWPDWRQLAPGEIVGDYDIESHAQFLQNHLRQIGVPTTIQTNTNGRNLRFLLVVSTGDLRLSIPTGGIN